MYYFVWRKRQNKSKLVTVNKDVENQPLNRKEVKSYDQGCSEQCYSVDGNVVKFKCENCAQKAVNTLITQEWIK